MTKASNQCLEMLKLLHEWRSGTAAKVQNKRSVFLLKSEETCLGEILSDDVTIWRVTIQICFSEHIEKASFYPWFKVHKRIYSVFPIVLFQIGLWHDSTELCHDVTIQRRNILPKQNHKWRDDGKGQEAQQARGHQEGVQHLQHQNKHIGSLSLFFGFLLLLFYLGRSLELMKIEHGLTFFVNSVCHKNVFVRKIFQYCVYWVNLPDEFFFLWRWVFKKRLTTVDDNHLKKGDWPPQHFIPPPYISFADCPAPRMFYH